MTDRDRTSPKDPARAARDKRLAEALRANLRRRKAGAGAASAGGAAPRSGPDENPGGGENEGGPDGAGRP